MHSDMIIAYNVASVYDVVHVIYARIADFIQLIVHVVLMIA